MLGWDPVARKPRWRFVDPSGGGDGGTLSTAGNLMFAGGGERQFIAYNAETGERIWHFTAQTGIAAGPISYEIDGEQYVAVAAGRGLQPYYQPNYSRLLAFKLGGSAQLPPPLDYTPPPLDPPESTASADVLARGGAVYGQNCVQCHGNTIGTFPDLRASPAIKSQELFDAIVLNGARAANGMVSFASQVTPEDARAVREYVITLAIQEKAVQDAAAARAAPPPRRAPRRTPRRKRHRTTTERDPGRRELGTYGCRTDNEASLAVEEMRGARRPFHRMRRRIRAGCLTTLRQSMLSFGGRISRSGSRSARPRSARAARARRARARRREATQCRGEFRRGSARSGKHCSPKGSPSRVSPYRATRSPSGTAYASRRSTARGRPTAKPAQC